MPHTHFFGGFWVRNDATRIDFTTRASRCRNGNNWGRELFNRSTTATTLLHIVPNMATVSMHNGRSLSAVHHRATTQGDEEVAPFLCHLFSDCLHSARQGIRFYYT